MIPLYKNKYVENSLNSTLNDMHNSYTKTNNKNNLTYLQNSTHTSHSQVGEQTLTYSNNFFGVH